MCVYVTVCQSFWSGRTINERERGRERGEGVREKDERIVMVGNLRGS